MSFSAIDINDKAFIVQTEDENGDIIRYRDSQGLGEYLKALQIVAYEMALEGIIKVRFHNGHYHIVILVD